MTDDGLLLVAVVEMADGHAEAGRRYEDAVLALLGRHGGTLERRLREDSGTEVHVIRFAERSGLDSFMVDPERLALRAELGDAAPTTRVLQVHDV
ncbi:hypothetical protein OHA21_23965 [Actinoplanes sp. NBC_00393]|uniref:hypothetical protein n=1 Tax=Actinoplanes sp. NBC_00393 TaxID=2975953 RepID=UPI002E229D23